MLTGYQRMPTEVLLSIEEVVLTTPVASIVSRAGVRVNCHDCGEEIINERDIIHAGRTLCQACASPAYYQTVSPGILVSNLLTSDTLVNGTAK